jgi:ABC-type phosphate transport system substrate-binding protein
MSSSSLENEKRPLLNFSSDGSGIRSSVSINSSYDDDNDDDDDDYSSSTANNKANYEKLKMRNVGAPSRWNKRLSPMDKCCGRCTSTMRLVSAVTAVTLISLLFGSLVFAVLFFVDERREHAVRSTLVLGGGSSFIGQTVKDIGRTFDDADVDVVVSDSGRGLIEVYNDSAQFALTDYAPSKDLVVASAMYPMAAGTLQFVANVPSAGADNDTSDALTLRLSREAIVGIYAGNISHWDDGEVQRHNRHMDLPHRRIRPLHRSDVGSGSTFLFLSVLCRFSATNAVYRWPSCPPQPDDERQWPVPNSDGIIIVGSASMMTTITNNAYSLGYASSSATARLQLSHPQLAAAAEQRLNEGPSWMSRAARGVPASGAPLWLAALENGRGRFVVPSTDSLRAAVDATSLREQGDHVMTRDIMDVHCDECYPFAQFSNFLFVEHELAECSREAKGMQAFANYYFGDSWRAPTAAHPNSVASLLASNGLVSLNRSDTAAVLHDMHGVGSNGECRIDTLAVPPYVAALVTMGGTLALGVLASLLIYACRRDRWQRAYIAIQAEQEPLVRSSRNFSQRASALLVAAGVTVSGDELIIREHIASGGLADVFVGEWCGARVAVKRLRLPPTDVHLVRNEFLSETTLMSRLRHPHVVQIYSCCLEPQLTLVLEYLPLSLEDVLFAGDQYSQHDSTALRQRLSGATKLRIARDIASGMLYLHSRDPPVLHRDLKVCFFSSQVWLAVELVRVDD